MALPTNKGNFAPGCSGLIEVQLFDTLEGILGKPPVLVKQEVTCLGNVVTLEPNEVKHLCSHAGEGSVTHRTAPIVRSDSYTAFQ